MPNRSLLGPDPCYLSSRAQVHGQARPPHRAGKRGSAVCSALPPPESCVTPFSLWRETQSSVWLPAPPRPSCPCPCSGTRGPAPRGSRPALPGCSLPAQQHRGPGGLWQGSPGPHAPVRKLRTPAPPLGGERREGRAALRSGQRREAARAPVRATG